MGKLNERKGEKGGGAHGGRGRGARGAGARVGPSWARLGRAGSRRGSKSHDTHNH